MTAVPYCLPELTREMEAALAWLLEAADHADPGERLALADRLAEIRAELLEEP